jgi:hypothetical protein
MNFVVDNMTSLRYLIPITICGNKRSIKSDYFICKDNRKYNSCSIKENLEQLVQLSKIYNFNIHDVDKINDFTGLTFFVEGGGNQYTHDNLKKVSITYMSDFIVLYQKYISDIDYVIFPNKFFAEFYKDKSTYPIGGGPMGETLSKKDKNLYLGASKYDIVIDKEEVIKKYSLPNDKNALIIFPLLSFVSPELIEKIYMFLKQLGFTIIVKSRAKDNAPNHLHGDYFFNDVNWFPHVTMELIEAVDIVVNFGSTTIKECIMANKPVVNFEIRNFKHLEFLYDGNHCIDLDINEVDFNIFKNSINKLLTSDLSNDFELARKKFLFEKGNICNNILDLLYDE